MVRRYQRSGLRQAEFARREGIGLSTLQGWLREARAALQTQGAAPRFVQAVLSPSSGVVAHKPPTVYRVRVGDALCVEIPSGFDPGEAATLLRAAMGVRAC